MEHFSITTATITVLQITNVRNNIPLVYEVKEKRYWTVKYCILISSVTLRASTYITDDDEDDEAYLQEGGIMKQKNGRGSQKQQDQETYYSVENWSMMLLLGKLDSEINLLQLQLT